MMLMTPLSIPTAPSPLADDVGRCACADETDGTLVSEYATDVPKRLDVPANRLATYCPVTRTGWVVVRSAARCHGCGGALGIVHPLIRLN